MSITNAAARLGPFKFFEGLNPEELTRAGMHVDEQSPLAKQVLYKQGELPAFLYLVESGEVLIEGIDPGDKRVVIKRVARAGDMAGRRAAADNVRHLATATVQQDARLLAISMGNLRILLNMFPLLRERLARTEVINRLLAIPLFADFDPQEVVMVADLVREVSYVAGQTIFRQGDLPDAMYVIDAGQVIETVLAGVASDGSWPKYLAAGSFFGRAGLAKGSARRASAHAATDVRLFRIGGGDLAWLLQFKPQLEIALRRPDMINQLGGTHLFSRLTLAEVKHLAGYTGLAHYRPGTTIMRQGETDRTLYILYKGQALARTSDVKGHFRPPQGLVRGAVLGEHSLFLNEPHAVTVEAPVPSDWMYVSRDDLDRYLDERPDVRPRLQHGTSVQERQRLKRYAWMDPDEQILLRRRRHWFALAERVALPLAPLLIGVLLLLLPTRGSHLLLTVLGAPIAFLSVLWILWVVLDWSNDFYIVTTKRVVRIERVIFISNRREEVPLDKVQNINLSQDFAGNYFGFGTLVIETAASFGGARIRFAMLPNPSAVQEQIFDAMSRVSAGRQHQTKRAIRDKLAMRMGGGNQPYVPGVATAPHTHSPAPVPVGGWRRRLGRVPRPRPFWIEKKTANDVTWRKHWIRLVARVWAPTLVFVAVLLALIVVEVQRPSARISVLTLVLGVVVLLPVAGWWWWGWRNWGNDLYIATNDRLIDLEKTPLGFRTQKTETTFDKVQNVSFEIPHPIATILNYGTVIIHTAGAQGQLTFQYVRDPSAVQTEIFRRLTQYNERRRRGELEERWADLPEWFAAYAEMRPGNQP